MELLLCDEDGDPVLDEPIDTRAALELAGEAHASPAFLRDDAANQNALPEQRWGLVLPEGEVGDRLQALLQPLIRHRQAQQEGHEVRTWRVPERMSPTEAWAWRKKAFDASQDTLEDLPKYVLIAGDFDQVPLAVQQVLGTDSFVGRLAFDRDRDYAAYADKAVRWDAHRAAEGSRARALFHTVHDGTGATHASYRALMQPGIEIARQRSQSGHFLASEILELGDHAEPSPEDLLPQLGSADPTVLLSVSHGQGPPRRRGWLSEADQRERQGALSFGRGAHLIGSDVVDKTVLPGGVWVMQACFGGGTPQASAYHPWLERLAAHDAYRGPTSKVLEGLSMDQRPFVAGLPRALLASPGGPLAVIGHVDLAWTYAMQDHDVEDGRAVSTSRPGRYVSILTSLLKGNRVGVAMQQLYRFVGQVATELSTLEAGADLRAAHLNMLREDLSAYVLLGDPASRLPVQPVRAKTRAQPSMGGLLGFSSSAAPAEGLGLELDKAEEAIAELILGERGARAIARDLGIDRGELDDLVDRYRQAGRRAIADLL